MEEHFSYSKGSGKARREFQCFRCVPPLILKFNFKISVVDFGERASTFRLKIYSRSLQRAGNDKIPLADLLKIHLDVEVDPQDGKSSRVCAKCALKIRNASTLIEFIMTTFNRENTDTGKSGRAAI